VQVHVQRGFSDSNPVTLEELPSDGVVVEQGLPPEAVADEAEAAGASSEGALDVSEKPAPAKASKDQAKGGRAR
jgi:hypothetical protein